MKKRLEADLISIAHRILQLKNKSDINQLYLETQKLYEKLAVLRFVDAEFGDTKPTIGQAEIEKQIEEAFDKKEVPQPEPVIVEEAKTETTVETPLETAPENDSLFEVDDAEIEEEIISENIEKSLLIANDKDLSKTAGSIPIVTILDNIISHPSDPNGNQKWNIRPRYLLFNIIPLIFGNKQTIELSKQADFD